MNTSAVEAIAQGTVVRSGTTPEPFDSIRTGVWKFWRLNETEYFIQFFNVSP